MLSIVVPIAGRGSRFAKAGFTLPKPLIPIHGMPMVELVVHNIAPRRAHRFIFLALEDHLDRTPLRAVLLQAAPGCEVIPVRETTQGAACTVLLARTLIDTDAPVMLANGDQYVNVDIDDYLQAMDQGPVDGLIMTFRANDPKWSYVRLGPSGLVEEVAEKRVISNEATVGIYNYRRGHDFVRAADEMITRNLRINDEFYVAPTYNQLIERGAKIVTWDIGTEGLGMHGLGTPEDLQRFLASDFSLRAVGMAPHR